MDLHWPLLAGDRRRLDRHHAVSCDPSYLELRDRYARRVYHDPNQCTALLAVWLFGRDEHDEQNAGRGFAAWATHRATPLQHLVPPARQHYSLFGRFHESSNLHKGTPPDHAWHPGVGDCRGSLLGLGHPFQIDRGEERHSS